MRQIILDTETTGLNPKLGHRVIEIAAIVIQDRVITEESFHTYCNPQRESDEAAFAIHGLSQEFLKDKPLFKDQLDHFLSFITKGEKISEVIIHNAPFDVNFLNAEIALCQSMAIENKKSFFSPYKEFSHYCKITDSLKVAQSIYPNQQNNLNALCKRLGVNYSERKLHSALLDVKLLADVYLRMTAGQGSLLEELESPGLLQTHVQIKKPSTLNSLPILQANELEEKAHKDQLASIMKQAGICLWQD